MGTMTKEWKGSAAIADTNERLFWKDEQLGEVVNITSTGRQNSLTDLSFEIKLIE